MTKPVSAKTMKNRMA